jgi:hypothetical protein
MEQENVQDARHTAKLVLAQVLANVMLDTVMLDTLSSRMAHVEHAVSLIVSCVMVLHARIACLDTAWTMTQIRSHVKLVVNIVLSAIQIPENVILVSAAPALTIIQTPMNANFLALPLK